MKQEEIKIVLKHKATLFFLAMIIKTGDAFSLLMIEDDKELLEGFHGNKSMQPYYLEDGLFELGPGGNNELKILKEYKPIKSSGKLIIIDNSILKAKEDEDVDFYILIADYRKGNSINFKYIKNYIIMHFINMSGYFLVVVFPRPGTAQRLLRTLPQKRKFPKWVNLRT